MTLDELDKLAGIHVMEWELRMPSRVWIIKREKSLPAIDTGKQHNKGPHQNRWQPTRNIAQAFECLEKLNPYAFNLQRSSRGFSVGILLRFGEKFLFEPPMQSNNFHSTASEAIVRACLRAKEVEV